MKTKLINITQLNMAISEALETTQALMEQISARVDDHNSKASAATKGLSEQPSGGKLIYHSSEFGGVEIGHFALLGEFRDLLQQGVTANYISLRNDICGGFIELENLDGWLSNDAAELVYEMESRAIELAAMNQEIELTNRELRRIQHRLASFEGRIETRTQGDDPSEWDYY